MYYLVYLQHKKKTTLEDLNIYYDLFWNYA